MNYLSLSSRGEIDAQALCLMGASVKDTGSIGEFGSGLKYALATLLRTGTEFEVWSGLRQIDIQVRPEIFRGQDFGVIWIDGKATSITTRTGPKWHLRDAIRELWSNAIDEGEASRDHEPQAGRSTFRIKVNPTIEKMLRAWDQYFVHDVAPIFTCRVGRMLRQPITNYFRLGVWICEDQDKPGLFSYDFTDMNLPESRRINSISCAMKVNSVLQQLIDVTIWSEIINHPKAEASMEVYTAYYYGMSFAAKSAIKFAFHTSWTHYGLIEERTRISHKLRPEHKVMWVGDYLGAVLKSASVPHIFAGLNHNDDYEVTPWPIGFEDRVMDEVQDLRRFGVDLAKFNIAFAQFREDQTIAQADMKSMTCLIGAKALKSDALDLRKALIEEWTHLEHMVEDCTVAQQHVYLDLILKLMENGND